MGQKLGQHFLNSKAVVKVIAEAANISPGEKILEIGPGKGILTEELLQQGAEVVAVEKDPELAELLQNKFRDEIFSGQLNLIKEDIRDFNTSNHGLTANKYKLVANIPYYITGELLKTFLSQKNQPRVIVFLMQNEVAKRIVGSHRPVKRGGASSKESILSISVKVYGKPTFVKKVSKRYFSPPPKVDSAILKIESISKKIFNDLDEENFFKIVKTGFAQKRKKLSNNLEKIESKKRLLEIFEEIGIDSNARAEDIPLEKWIALTKKLSVKV